MYVYYRSILRLLTFLQHDYHRLGLLGACSVYDDFNACTLSRFCFTTPSIDTLCVKVHAIFGDTLMLAGVARIVEVSFITPRYAPLPDSGAADDNNSEHTLADGPASGNTPLMQSVKAFRHLPPFVSDKWASRVLRC